MTNNGGAAVTDRIRTVGTSEFQIQLSEEEAADHRHNEETVGFIAISTGLSDSGSFNALTTGNTINHRISNVSFGELGEARVVLSDMQSRNGGDNANVRHHAQGTDHVKLFIEEERSKNTEIAHINENVGLVALAGGIIRVEDGGRSMKKSGDTKPSSAIAREAHFENTISLALNRDSTTNESTKIATSALAPHALVLEKLTSSRVWFVGDEIPTEEVKSFWDESFAIETSTLDLEPVNITPPEREFVHSS